MGLKQLLIAGIGTTVVGGGATGAYFLWPEKTKEQNTNQSVSLRSKLTNLNFLNTDNDDNKEQWGKLVDKFLEEGQTSITKIKTTEIQKKESTDNKDENIAALKKACTTLLDKTNFEEDDKEIAKNWCTKESTLLAETRPATGIDQPTPQ